MFKILGLLLIPCMAFAAVQGAPEPVFPGPSPALWVDLGNDNLVPGQPDDRLTASWAMGARDGDWLLGAEYGMLTSKAAGTRQDELTVTLGTMCVDESGYRFSAAAGFRNYHNLNGQDLQNSEHKRAGDPEIALTYDGNLLTGIAVFDFRQTKLYTVGDAREGYFYVIQDGITSRANEIECWGGPVYDCTMTDEWTHSYTWIGAGYRSYRGAYFGATDEAVQKAYEGWSFRGGVKLENLTATLVIGTHASYGTIGLAF